MKFVKEDYHKAQQKKWTIIIISCVAIFCIALLYHSYSQRSAAEKEFSKVAPSETPELVKRAIKRREDKKPEEPGKRPEKMELPALVKRVERGIGLIMTYDRDGKPLGQGTGFFINRKGHAVSNYHVFRGSHRAEIKLPAGTFKVDKVLAEDVKSDLLLFSVKIKSGSFRALSFHDTLPDVGERIVVIGNPLGLEASVSDGIVSARRKVEPFGSVIQITSPISPGSSGSPVFSMRGEVIGVATFQAREGQNINFAIPIANAKKLVPTGEKELADLTFADVGELAAAGNAFSKGMVYYEAGEYGKAAAQFQAAVEEDSTDVEAYFYLGMSYRGNRPFDAIDAFKRAVRLDPEYKEAYCNLGIVYNSQDMFKRAIDALREATELDPDYNEALVQLGIAYASDKEFRAAAKVLSRAVDFEPDARAFFYLGLTYMAIRDYDKALDAFQWSVDEDPKFYEGYIGLGYGYAAFKNWRQGIISVKRAESIEPGHPEIHYLLGIFYLGDNDVPAAEMQARLLRDTITKWKGKKIAIYDERKLSDMLHELERFISQYKSRHRRRRR